MSHFKNFVITKPFFQSRNHDITKLLHKVRRNFSPYVSPSKIGFLLMLIALLSCTSEKRSQKDVFKYNEHKNIRSLDPAFAKDKSDIWACNQVFNGLVQLDSQLNIQPAIAKSYTISEDGKQYVFTLRNDVYFHKNSLFGKDSTRVVNASDFLYSFQRLLDPDVASPGGWVFGKVKNFKVLNDSVFQINLKTPFPAFLGLLSMKYCSVIPKEVVSSNKHDFGRHPIGTGPFYFKNWIENTKLVFRKNNLYFETDSLGVKLPYLEAISISFLPEKQSEFLQFIQGNIDMLNALDVSYQDELLNKIGELSIKYKDQYQLLKSPYLNTEYLAFYLDSKNPVILSAKIREAINLGFDRSKLIKYARNGVGIPAYGGFIPKGMPGHNNTIGYDFNPKKARDLVNEFKTETGISNPSLTLTTTSNYVVFGEIIQKEMEKIGIEANLNVVPPATLREAKANGKLDFFRASWVADYPDAENYLSLYYSPNFAPNGPNYTHYNDKAYDSLYHLALQSPKIMREQLYQIMDEKILENATIVPLFYDEAIRFVQKNIQGMEMNPIDLLELKNVKKSE